MASNHTWECEDCGETYYECEKTYRRLREDVARFRLMKHRRICTKAQVLKLKEEVKSAGKGYCNCPVCNEVKRIDKVVAHCLSKHRTELAYSMPNDQRKAMRDIRLPILWGFEPYAKSARGAKTMWVCLHCKKGCSVHTKRHEDFDITVRELLRAHKDCIEHYEPYSHFFEDAGAEDGHALLPFVCRRLLDADLKRIREPTAEEAPSTVLEVKEPDPDTFGLATTILDLKEENERLKKELEKAKKQTLLSETTKALLLGIVEPDEDLGDEDLIEESVRAYQSLLRRATGTKRRLDTALETKEVIQDIFENIMDADSELFARCCTKEQVEVLRTYLRRD